MTIDPDRQIAVLKTRNAWLETEVERLTQLINKKPVTIFETVGIPRCLGLTRKEKAIVSILLCCVEATKEELMDIYTLTHSQNEIPNVKIIDVFVAKMRPKLRKFDIEVETVWGTGYALTPENKQKIRALLDSEKGKAA